MESIASSPPRPKPARVPHVLQSLRQVVARGLPRDPIMRIALIASLVRVVGLVRLYVGTNLIGQPVAPAPGRILPWAIPYHVGVLVALGFVCALIARIGPRTRRAALMFSACLFACLVFAGQVDLEILRGLGEHLTIDFARQHLSGAMFSDIGDGMADDAPHLIGSGLIVLAGWVGIVALAWRHRRDGVPQARPLQWHRVAATPALSCILVLWPHAYHPSARRLQLVAPPEVLALRDVLGLGRTAAPPDEEAAAKALQAALTPPGTAATWLDPKFPLWHAPFASPGGGSAPQPDAARPDTVGADAVRPDIYMIVVESLRGREVAPARAAADHPNLARLAGRAVTFPYFVSNGFPSAQGFFSLTCSGLPHPRGFILVSNTAADFDCLPVHLGALGYQRAFFIADNPQMDNQLPWIQHMYDEVHLEPDQTYDRKLVDDVAGWLAARDAAGDARPLFAWLGTISTHFPFLPHDLEFVPGPSDDYNARYHAALAYSDRELGRLLNLLEARKRPAIIVVIGDHAFPTDEPSVGNAEDLPCDRHVWTAAYIEGPRALVGAPRTETFPASQVDIMPTLLRIAGDTAPTASLGRDLLDGNATGRHAWVVSHAGVRLDVGDVSVFRSLDGQSVWAEDRVRDNLCQPTVEVTPELRRQVDAVADVTETWAWLVESRRVAPSGAAP